MNSKNTVVTSDDALVISSRLRCGDTEGTIMNLPAILKDRGPLGNGLLNILARIRKDPELLEYMKDIENLIDKIGRQPENNLIRALEALNDAPLLITRGTPTLVTQARTDPILKTDIQYIETAAGPVVIFDLWLGNKRLSAYIDPLTIEGYGFLMAAWQFPLFTWALVEQNLVKSIQHYDARYLTDKLMEICKKATMSRRVITPDFRTAVTQAKLMLLK